LREVRSVVPRAAILATKGVGACAVVGAAVFLVSPSAAIDVWPWTLTPLTARVVGLRSRKPSTWVFLGGLVGLAVAVLALYRRARPARV
jgi:hypothetical protein